MKKSDLTAAFRKTAREFPDRAEVLNTVFDATLSRLGRGGNCCDFCLKLSLQGGESGAAKYERGNGN